MGVRKGGKRAFTLPGNCVWEPFYVFPQQGIKEISLCNTFKKQQKFEQKQYNKRKTRNRVGAIVPLKPTTVTLFTMILYI